MISITQRLAGQLKTVFRQALDLPTRGTMPPVQFSSGSDGVRIRCRGPEAAAELHLAGEQPAEAFWIPFELLSDVEGRKEIPVEIRLHEDTQVLASWREGSVPQMVQHQAANPAAGDWPPLPEQFGENPPEILSALSEAGKTIDPYSERYALGCLQLQGDQGKIAATDGKQLLIHSGFAFPWEGEILVPASKIFGSAQLPNEQPVFVGRSEKWFTFRLGPWTFHLAINSEGRFPKVEDHIQRVEYADATFQMSPADRQFVIENLSRLPSNDTYNNPVTIDLNGSVTFRSRAEGQTTSTELILSSSSRNGEPIRFNTNRQYLQRAATLGFHQVYFFGDRAPILCQDDHRQYTWAPLDPEYAIKPANDAIRIESPAEPSQPQVRQPRRKPKEGMPRKTPEPASEPANESAAPQNGRSRKPSAAQSTPEEPGTALQQAVALRDALREAASKAGELIRTLRREKKQSKLLKSTLASLREIQSLEV